MGLLTAEVERDLMKAKGMISAKMPIFAQAGGLICNGMPVVGVITVDTPQINSQMDAILDCLESIVKTLKKLEERK